MPKFKPCNYQQAELIALNYEGQLQQGTFDTPFIILSSIALRGIL